MLLYNLLTVMRIITPLAFVSDLQMDRCLVDASSRARFEDGLAFGARVAFHENLPMFPIHVSLQVATGCTSERTKVTLLPILLVVDLLVD